MRVAVLRGGRSSEHEVSLDSGASVAEGLRGAGHDVVVVDVGLDGRWRVGGEEVALRAGGGLLGCDVAFPVLHGAFGEDGTVQGVFEILDVAYVGAGVLASAACMDKVVFKELMAQAGLPQVGYVLINEGDDVAAAAALGFPCWVKPSRMGSSVGIVRVVQESELAAALTSAFTHDPRVIVEASAPGIEVECAVLFGHTLSARASTPGEIVLRGGAGWYDYEAKYAPGGMELVVPARISDAAIARLRGLAVGAFAASGCSGLARADFFVDGDDVLLNELNTMPGFTETSVYGKLWEASGLAYGELVTRLCEIGAERFERERAYRF